MFKDKSKCRLILDSCCDLPADLVADSGVELFEFPFIMNDGEHLDDLYQSMNAKEFYDRMRKGETSGTAQIPIPTLVEMFEKCAQEGAPTVYIAFSSGLSGTFETVETVLEDIRERYPEFEVYAVDTKLASIAEGLIAYEAINQRNRGLTAKQLAAWAEEAKWFVNCIFTVDDLEYLRRGGRIPTAAATIGSKLNIKPMLNIDLDGGLALIGVARGRKKSLKAIVKQYDEDHAEENSPSDLVLIGSSDAEGDAKWIEEHLDRPDGSLPPLYCQIGPVIGSHVGPGMAAIAYWGEDRRKNVSLTDRIANRINSEE